MTRESLAFGAAIDHLQSRIRETIVPLDDVIRHTPTGGTAIELGCGQGLLLKRLRPRVDRCVGLDFDGRKLRMARTLLKRDTPTTQAPVELIEADLLGFLAAETKKFDSALLVDTLSSFPPEQQFEVITGAVGILKPGGTLLLKIIDVTPAWKVAASRMLSGLVYRVLRLSLSKDQRFWYLPSTDYAAHLRKLGCRVERVSLHDHHLIPHVLLIARTAA